MPQILGVLNSRSAAGLNLASFELENIGYSIHTAYGFILGLPFSAFGEAVIILLQNTILLSIIYYFARAPLWRAFLMTVLTAFGGYFVLSGMVKESLCNTSMRSLIHVLCSIRCQGQALNAGNATEKMVMSAYELNNFIFILARVPQIWSNFKVYNWQTCHEVPCQAKPLLAVQCINSSAWPHRALMLQLALVVQAKNTGQLSLITSGMSTAGALARIFTSIQEGAGLSMVRGFCIGMISPDLFCDRAWPNNSCKHCCANKFSILCIAGGILNLIITLQILWYAKNTRTQAKRLAKKKE